MPIDDIRSAKALLRAMLADAPCIVIAPIGEVLQYLDDITPSAYDALASYVVPPLRDGDN